MDLNVREELTKQNLPVIVSGWFEVRKPMSAPERGLQTTQLEVWRLRVPSVTSNTPQGAILPHIGGSWFL